MEHYCSNCGSEMELITGIIRRISQTLSEKWGQWWVCNSCGKEEDLKEPIEFDIVEDIDRIDVKGL